MRWIMLLVGFGVVVLGLSFRAGQMWELNMLPKQSYYVAMEAACERDAEAVNKFTEHLDRYQKLWEQKP